MALAFEELPGWHFDADEVSAGVFRATGFDQFGRSVEATGTDPNELLERCRRDAVKMVTAQPPKE